MTDPSAVAAGVRVLVVRHGRSEANLGRVIAGGLDTPLAPEGRAQAEALADLVATRSLSAIYSSPLRRAIDTARPAAATADLAIQVIDAFRELSFGALEGRSRDRDLPAHDAYEAWRADPGGYVPPGGEALADLEARVVPALDEVIASHRPGDSIMIVGHNIANRVMLGALMTWTRPDYAALSLSSRHVYEITTPVAGESPAVRTIRLGGSRHGAVTAGFVL